MAKNYSSSNKTVTARMVTTQQTRTKQIQVWGIKTHLTRLQTRMQRILQTRMHLTHLTATVMMRVTDTNQS